MSKLLSYILEHVEDFRRARLPSLYSDFTSQRHTNPDGYIANLTAWEGALYNAAKAGVVISSDNQPRRFVLEADQELLRSLETREWGRPQALNTVIDEAINRRMFIPLSVFLSSPATIYRQGWTLFSSNVLVWGLGKLGFAPKASASGGIRARHIVLLRNLEEAAGTITSKMIDVTNQVDRIFTRSTFNEFVMEALGVETMLAPIDLDVMLKFLARDRQVLAYDDQTVKFKSVNGTITPISKEDKSIASLKLLIASLKTQMSRLEDQITSTNNDTLRAIRTNRRVSALAALRSKKMAENTLAQRADTLSQLENVYHSIEQASDQLVIVNVLKDSSMALKKINEETRNIETVEDILDELATEVDKTNEVAKAIEERGQHDSIDESDIDDELEALLQSKINEENEKTAQQTKSRLDGTSSAVVGSEDLAESLQMLKLEEIGEPTNASSQHNMQAIDQRTLADHNGQLQKKVSEKNTGAGEMPNIVPEAS